MRAVFLALVAVVVFAGCGHADDGDDGPLTVYAASSLRDVLPAIDPDARYSFGSSGTLQTQVQRGAPADVFASASPTQARALHDDGSCSTPQVFATNTVVLVVPRDGAAVTTFADLRRGGLRIAVGAEGVPVGDYTRALLEHLGAQRVLTDNRVSEEKDVAGVVSKVALGSADAGFVYATDAKATTDRTAVVGLPGQEPAEYAICVVSDSEPARAFVEAVRSPRGQATLRRFGFGTP